VGKHSKQSRHTTQPRGAVEMIDTGGTAHLVTVTAAEHGLHRGRYTTMCAEEILPGALVARMARWCPLCAPIPAQRSR
jgi:hypothetical protein